MMYMMYMVYIVYMLYMLPETEVRESLQARGISNCKFLMTELESSMIRYICNVV